MNNRPDWLKIRVRNTEEKDRVEEMLSRLSLHTVCEAAACPNLLECFNRRTATFMILGEHCTRNCRFCNVTCGKPSAVDAQEPERLAEAVLELNLRHVVITSVTRDDLPDGGSAHFAKVVEALRQRAPEVTVEVLIPDFQGDRAALQTVVDAHPDVLNHNVETVPRLYAAVRPQADYRRSLELLARVREMDGSILTKSGIMVGLSETQEEVVAVMEDLRAVGCDLLTVGQYLPPSKEHIALQEYVTPETFEFYKREAYRLGFRYAACAPLVRSSYHAGEALEHTEGDGR